jgi:acetate kinase
VLNPEANPNNDQQISIAGAKVKIYVLPTDEEQMMAQIINELISI